MARNLFGGSDTDRVVDGAGNGVAGRRVRFYTDASRTTEITDLTSDSGGATPVAQVLTDDLGYWPEVYGPDGVLRMYAGAENPAGTPPTRVYAIYTHSTVAGGGGGASVAVDSDGTLTVDLTTVELATDAQLTAEATARADADTALDTRVTALEGAPGGGSTVTVDADGTLTVDGTTVELATDAQLTAEATSRASGDTANADALTAHENDATAAHAASAVSLDPTGLGHVSGTDVQAAVAELDGAITSGTAGVSSFNGRDGAVSLTKADVTGTGLAAADVGADPAGSAAAVTTTSIGAVPTSRTVNGHALTGNVTVTAADVGADPAGAAAAVTTSSIGAQPADADLTALAGLDSTTAGTIATDGTGWVKKTYAAFKTALGITAGDVSGLGGAALLDVGTTAGTVAAGDDARFSQSATSGTILVYDGSAWPPRPAGLADALATYRGPASAGTPSDMTTGDVLETW